MKKTQSSNLHAALKFSDADIFVKAKKKIAQNVTFNQRMKNLDEKKKEKKRKFSDLQNLDNNTNLVNNKKIRLSDQSLNALSPLGLVWDSENYSCAYDSFFTVLYHIWVKEQLKHKAYFESGTHWIRILHSNFALLYNKTFKFEYMQDHLRAMLHQAKPLDYRYGKEYTDIDNLVRDFITIKELASTHSNCSSCDFTMTKLFTYFQGYTAVGWSERDCEELKTATIQAYLNYKILKIYVRTNKLCPKCHHSLYDTQSIDELPSVLIFAIAPWIDINQCLAFNVLNHSKKYHLKGAIYWNHHHFTARLIDKIFNIWYHDGQSTGSLCAREQTVVEDIDIFPLKLVNQYHAIMAFYVQT